MKKPETQSLYSYIAENRVNGELPKDFSLPRDAEPGKVQFADGAMDGIAIYHMGMGTLDETAQKEMSALIHLISDGKTAEADLALTDFTGKHTALSVIDPWQDYIIENRDRLQAGNLYHYGVDKLLNATKIDEVKYGMILLELFTLQDEKVKDAVRTVGLSDEFTLFSVFIMLRWDSANDEIFELAKHVRGWGRIHAIDRLEASTQEISDWLLHEGVENWVLPAYSALTCFEKADVPGRLGKTLSHEEFSDIGKILESMLDEGPCQGISAVGDDILVEYIGHVTEQILDFADYQRIFAFLQHAKDNENSGLQEQCEKLLYGEECRSLVTQEVQQGEGIELAVLLGVEYGKPLLDCMEHRFDENYHKVFYLMGEDAYADQAIALFTRKLPLKQMQTGPAEEIGVGREYADYSKLIMIVQELKDKPGKGEQHLETALRAPVINNRNMALTVLESWVEAAGKPLEDISPAMYETLLEAKQKEMVEKVRERMEKLVTCEL